MQLHGYFAKPCLGSLGFLVFVAGIIVSVGSVVAVEAMGEVCTVLLIAVLGIADVLEAAVLVSVVMDVAITRTITTMHTTHVKPHNARLQYTTC